jgi:hypothetical protein
MTKNECACNDCSCNHKEISPVIDADENDIMSLCTMKGEIVEKMNFIRNKYRVMLEADLASWQEEYERLDALLGMHYKPGCFGSMTCGDRDYEECPSSMVKECQAVCRSGRV